MSTGDDQAREHDRMRGAYLGLVASLEMNLTFLLAEWLEVGNHQEEFHDWFMEAPIPFRSKIRLYEALTKGGGLTGQFGDLAEQMRESYDFRNTLAILSMDSGALRRRGGRGSPTNGFHSRSSKTNWIGWHGWITLC